MWNSLDVPGVNQQVNTCEFIIVFNSIVFVILVRRSLLSLSTFCIKELELQKMKGLWILWFRGEVCAISTSSDRFQSVTLALKLK